MNKTPVQVWAEDIERDDLVKIAGEERTVTRVEYLTGDRVAIYCGEFSKEFKKDDEITVLL